MSQPPNLTLNEDGTITRDEDKKLVATVKDGKIEYSAPAYAKAVYKETIEALVSGEIVSEPEPEEAPKPTPESEEKAAPVKPVRDPHHGAFSAEFLNYDFATMKEEEFSAKWKPSAEVMLEWIVNDPGKFHNIPALEERLTSLAQG